MTEHETYCTKCNQFYITSPYGCPCRDDEENQADDRNDRDWIDNLDC